MESISLEGKTAIITGANSGIGKEVARELAKIGCRVILACREESSALAAIDEIEEDPDIGQNKLVFYQLSLESLDSIKSFTEVFLRKESRLDLLVNNAGIYSNRRRQTLDRFEMMMGVNYIGHYYLTELLMEKLKEGDSSRIINVVCKASSKSNVDLDDFNSQKNWKSMRTFGRSKAALVHFTIGLSIEYAGSGVTALSVDPGPTKTKFFKRTTGCDKCCMGCSAKTSHKRASDVVYCCIEPTLEEKSGKAFRNRNEVPLKESEFNQEKAKNMWIATRKMLNLEVND